VNLFTIIKELREEKARVDMIIERLEALAQMREIPAAKPKARRGRKNMSPEERSVVAERMRKYWQEQREKKKASAASA
jgi:hypothetical protein